MASNHAYGVRFDFFKQIEDVVTVDNVRRPRFNGLGLHHTHQNVKIERRKYLFRDLQKKKGTYFYYNLLI